MPCAVRTNRRSSKWRAQLVQHGAGRRLRHAEAIGRLRDAAGPKDFVEHRQPVQVELRHGNHYLGYEYKVSAARLAETVGAANNAGTGDRRLETSPHEDQPRSPTSAAPTTSASGRCTSRRCGKSLHALVPREPQTPCVPALWRYDELRPLLMALGRTDQRRGGGAPRADPREPRPARAARAITQSLYAGLQLIMPGEVAPSHRHVQSALRFIVDGKGAYTTVDGERTTMYPGDFIITPSWAWHDHGNEGIGGAASRWSGSTASTSRWCASSTPASPRTTTPRSQQVTRPEGNSLARYGHNMVPVRTTHARRDLADLQLSVRAQPRGAGAAAKRRGARRLARPASCATSIR